MKRNAKIVATLGPSSESAKTLREMILAGMDVARLNFSHGTHEDHLKRIQTLRGLLKEMKKPVTILQDLSGPKMRVGDLASDGVTLQEGHFVHFTSSQNAALSGEGKDTVIPLDVPYLFESLKVGNRILLDDGKLEVVVTKITTTEIIGKVVIGGKLTSHKGVNLPGAALNIPAFTEKDKVDLKFGLENDVDMIAMSFVRSSKDILEVRNAIQELAPDKVDLPIIAKLERPEAIENLDSILSLANGVMVARGDLGVETSPSVVPIMQKEIIETANRMGKVVITATQMLESMMTNTRPTRAEASDIANAVFDGTDAVMLSGETASGQFPIESVAMMDRIVKEAESHFSEWGHCKNFVGENVMDDATAITGAARELAQDRNVAAIAVFTLTGHTALLMSKTRPDAPILAFTPFEKTYQRMNLYWGITPVLVHFSKSVEGMIQIVDEAILASTELVKGQQVVIISGLPVSAMRKPNFALLHTIGETYGSIGADK
jgi:pyruvate kinase